MTHPIFVTILRNGPTLLLCIALFNVVLGGIWGLTSGGIRGFVFGVNSGLLPFVAALVLDRFDRWQAGAA